MKYTEFLTLIESYYGKYNNDVQKNMVLNYLTKNVKEEDLRKLFELLVRNCSNKYGVPPAIFEIQDLITEVEAERQLTILNSISPRYNIICEDLATQQAIEALGGWVSFYDFLQIKSALCRKAFIEHYKKYRGIETKRKVLKGWKSQEYGEEINQHNTKVIGNKENINKEFMEEHLLYLMDESKL